MRKIFVTEFVSLDGVMEDPGGAEKSVHGGWTMPYWSDEIGKFKFDELLSSDALLLGRLTYQGFTKAWPSMNDEAGYGKKMKGFPEDVVSRTKEKIDWDNSHLIKGDIEKEGFKPQAESGQ